MNFKIIALSETAINSHHICYTIPGYAVEQDFRPKRKGGGVALYIDNNIQYKVRPDLNLRDDTNSILLEIDKNQLKSKYNTVIGCIYKPPSYSLKFFNDSLTDMLFTLQKKKKHILIAGDFNVNLDPSIRGDGNTQNFKNIFFSNFLFPLINMPTRVTNHSATVIYSNASDIVTTCRTGILSFLSQIIMLFFASTKLLISLLIKKLSLKETSLRNIFLNLQNVCEINVGFP